MLSDVLEGLICLLEVHIGCPLRCTLDALKVHFSGLEVHSGDLRCTQVLLGTFRSLGF